MSLNVNYQTFLKRLANILITGNYFLKLTLRDCFAFISVNVFISVNFHIHF